MSSLLTVNIVVQDALAAAKFYQKVFEGELGDVYEFPERQGENEANIQVGSVKLRLIDANPSYDCHPPRTDETDSLWFQLNLADVQKVRDLAVEAGAEIVQEIDEFMGTRHFQLLDPFGYTWTINQVIKEYSFAERYAAYQALQEEFASNQEASEEGEK